MRLVLAALAAISLAAGAKPDTAKAAEPSAASTPDASTATAPPQADPSAPGNAAVKAAHSENAGPAAAGANSFTEGQAKKHIENSGYANVTALSKDAQGLWHGTAMKDGKTLNVALDFKGNVVTN